MSDLNLDNIDAGCFACCVRARCDTAFIGKSFHYSRPCGEPDPSPEVDRLPALGNPVGEGKEVPVRISKSRILSVRLTNVMWAIVTIVVVFAAVPDSLAQFDTALTDNVPGSAASTDGTALVPEAPDVTAAEDQPASDGQVSVTVVPKGEVAEGSQVFGTSALKAQSSAEAQASDVIVLLEAMSVRLDSMSSRLDEVSSRQDIMTVRLDEVSSRLDQVSSRQDIMTVRLDAMSDRLDDRLDAMSDRLDEMSAKNSNFQWFISIIVASFLSFFIYSLTSINRRIGSLENKVEIRFAGLETRLNGLETRLGGVESKIAGIEIKIAWMETMFFKFYDTVTGFISDIIKSQDGSVNRLRPLLSDDTSSDGSPSQNSETAGGEAEPSS
jgi:hypothetical protein